MNLLNIKHFVTIPVSAARQRMLLSNSATEDQITSFGANGHDDYVFRCYVDGDCNKDDIEFWKGFDYCAQLTTNYHTDEHRGAARSRASNRFER